MKIVERAVKSPLRYPGGKTRAVKIIAQYIPEDLTEIVSPFLGGGSLELALASSGVKVKGFDIFPPLIHFWDALLDDPKALKKRVKKYYPIDKDLFKRLQKTHQGINSNIESGAVFYVLNRSSFSGSTLSGGMCNYVEGTKEHPRFTESSIDRIENFKIDNFEVNYGSFEDTLVKYKDTPLYLDPPYLLGKEKDKLYGNKGNTHQGFNHKALKVLLEECPDWIMSYNDTEEIREMYQGLKIVNPVWKYGMSKKKESSEVLILKGRFANDEKQ